MFKKCAFILVLALSVQTGLYAQKISGFIRDMDTREAIPYATVQFGRANGTVANEEGGFSISLHEGAADSILVSSMGYEQKRIPMLADGQELIIYLNPSAIQLDEVLLSNRRPTAEEIIRKVKESYPENYTSTNQKYNK